jgi:peptidoglycan/LPS O-acetylase OafA/YrhL
MVTQEQSEPDVVVCDAVPPSDVTRVRFGEIDGLRALAIGAAVLYETTRFAASGATWSPALARAFADASQGISLFFLLSGFVLAYPALATLRSDGRTYLDVGRFIVKRLLRIYPAYIVILALTFIVPALAVQYGLPALAGGTPGPTTSAFTHNLFFVGDGLGNDAFRALALEVRWFALFPLALLLWARWPRVFMGLIVVAAASDLMFPGAHALAVAALVPFMLGVVAADVRASHHRFERYAFILFGIAAIAAPLCERAIATLPGPAGASAALRIDPLWTLALFGLLVAASTSRIVERLLSLRLLRLLGVASYGIALVVVPVSSFIVRQLIVTVGVPTAVANAAIVSLLTGLIVWQAADRWFAEGTLRRDAAAIVGPWLNVVLRLVRLDRITLGESIASDDAADVEDAAVDTEFYAPPRRAGGDLAIVATRSGSPEDLAADILETKRRLSDRTSAIFAEAMPEEQPQAPQPPPPPPPPPAFEKPGFYRRSAPTAGSAPKATVVLPPPELQRTAQAVAAPPPPPRPAHAPSAAYQEPAPISISFQSPAYEHFQLQPGSGAPVIAPSHVAQPLPTRPVLPPSSTNRGPIKMRVGAVLTPHALANGNGNGTRYMAGGSNG